MNTPPQISEVVIAPSNPLTSDDLTLSATAVDLDGDPLTITYGWKRNGAVVAGQTSRTLPATATKVGDSITAMITANDGTVSVTAEANVPVMDTPTNITITGAPTTSPYGGHVEFNANATDPDEPSSVLPLKLAHGPAGMTIDPATGRVTWDATPPMFDRTMDVHWGITVDAPGAPVVSGTITVTDPARQYPLMRTGIEIPLKNAGLSVGDFDADGDVEAMILSNRSLYELEADGAGAYRQSWMYPFTLGAESPYHSYYGTLRTMATGDADGDGTTVADAPLFATAATNSGYDGSRFVTIGSHDRRPRSRRSARLRLAGSRAHGDGL